MIGGAERHYCSAFKDGIPDKIAYGDDNHSKPTEDQLNKRIVFAVGTNPRIVKPYLVRNMLNPRLHGRDNLCSTIRDIYVKTTDEEIKLWARLAMRMSKNMYNALQGYKNKLQELGVDVKAIRQDWQLKGGTGIGRK